MTQLHKKQATKVPEIRKGDTIVVLHGKDAGKRGVVDRIIRDPQGLAKRHPKPRSTGASTSQMPKMQAGGSLEIAQPMAISKGMVVCTSCERPTRVKHRSLDNGQRVRVCGHCGERLEVKG